ncbi:hypothetical protein SAMN04488069_12910 [Hymenobacter psychrophilus]|uniref:Uncharacterized protein n=1 Tax=Hymenobacter psychrophilus TaxID=651662 RepID=A0A1H3PDE3_9BACT|nr:hypothetical protein SAMN04488069_12910 [Hymenobacter psychrophilus]
MKRGLFLKARALAIWRLLTRKYFVVITCQPDGDMRCQYNVAAHSYRYMVATVLPILESHEGQSAALNQAKTILNSPKP